MNIMNGLGLSINIMNSLGLVMNIINGLGLSINIMNGLGLVMNIINGLGLLMNIMNGLGLVMNILGGVVYAYVKQMEGRRRERRMSKVESGSRKESRTKSDVILCIEDENRNRTRDI